MKVIWNKLAEAQLDRSIAYVSEFWSKAAGERLLRESRRISHLLATHPHLGAPEPLLAARPQGYRSIVVGHYNKFIYFVSGDVVYVSAVWDTRRDPSALVDEIS